MSRVSSGWRIVLIVFLCISGIIVLNADQWYRDYYPFNPLRVDVLEVVNDGDIYPGDLLTYHVKGEKFKTPFGGDFGTPVITIQVVDGFHWPAISGAASECRPAGPFEGVFITPALDMRAIPGHKYRMRWEAKYPEGRKAVVVKWSGYFSVVEKPDCPPGQPGPKGESGKKGDPGRQGPAGKNFWGR